MFKSHSSRPRTLTPSAENVAKIRAIYDDKGEARTCDFFSISIPTLSRLLARQPVSRVVARCVEIRLQSGSQTYAL